MFNDNIDRTLRRALDKLPEGNIGYAIVGLNTLFYGLYLLWPKGNMFAFYNNFTFSHFGLRQGCLHNMFTCHFAQMSLFHWALDSVIAFMFCRNLSQMFGNLFVAKTVLLSMFLGTFFVFMKEAALGVVPPFNGNDAILRGLIFSLIISNPQAQLMLFPLPINIPAWAIAALLLTMDFFTFNSAAFGGVSASYLMVNFFM